MKSSISKRSAIVGVVGVPGAYGGFETLAENLVRYHASRELDSHLTVYCSSYAYVDQVSSFLSAELRYIPLDANGAQSIPYDIWSLFSAVRHRADAILLLGVSGAIVLPLIRLISRARIITNIDGIEWKREKWKGAAKYFLRLSERIAVKWSHVVVADNQAIVDYVKTTYGRDCQMIAYGGDHALSVTPADEICVNLPEKYALALCRIEPENNIDTILSAFSEMPDQDLVFVGNWERSEYGKRLKSQYESYQNLHLENAIYESSQLRAIRDNAWLYVHGHSAGGTNPSLVEMMHFGVPVVAYDCSFNRYSTNEDARYFGSSEELARAVRTLDDSSAEIIGQRMKEIATVYYTWDRVGSAYFSLLR